MNDAVLPALRKDVKLLHEDGRALLVDPLIGIVHELSEQEAVALRALDGKRHVSEVARRAAVPPARVRALVEKLASDNLLETPAIRSRLDEHEKEHEDRWFDTPEKMVRLRKLPIADARAHWDCHACGMCCKGLTVPLRPDEMARIDASLYQDVLQGRSFHVPFVNGGGEPVERILRQVGKDDRCVFLAPDGLCRVHARQGAQFKPDTCQLFPLATIATGAGPRLTLRIACGSLHESSETGSPVQKYAQECFDLEHKEPVRGTFDAPLAGRTVPFERYAAIEREWRELLEPDGATPEFVLRAIPTSRERRSSSTDGSRAPGARHPLAAASRSALAGAVHRLVRRQAADLALDADGAEDVQQGRATLLEPRPRRRSSSPPPCARCSTQASPTSSPICRSACAACS